jgi:hypothetical protein
MDGKPTYQSYREHRQSTASAFPGNVPVPVKSAPHPAQSYPGSIGEEIESGVRPSAKTT